MNSARTLFIQSLDLDSPLHRDLLRVHEVYSDVGEADPGHHRGHRQVPDPGFEEGPSEEVADDADHDGQRGQRKFVAGNRG